MSQTYPSLLRQLLCSPHQLKTIFWWTFQYTPLYWIWVRFIAKKLSKTFPYLSSLSLFCSLPVNLTKSLSWWNVILAKIRSQKIISISCYYVAQISDMTESTIKADLITIYASMNSISQKSNVWITTFISYGKFK